MLRRRLTALVVAALATTAFAAPAARAVDTTGCDWVMPGDVRAAQACAVVMGTHENPYDPLLCSILKQHAGTYGYYYVDPWGNVWYFPVLYIAPDGDVWVYEQNTWVHYWDCPPYAG